MKESKFQWCEHSEQYKPIGYIPPPKYRGHPSLFKQSSTLSQGDFIKVACNYHPQLKDCWCGVGEEQPDGLMNEVLLMISAFYRYPQLKEIYQNSQRETVFNLTTKMIEVAKWIVCEVRPEISEYKKARAVTLGDIQELKNKDMNNSQVADKLGISRRTVINRLSTH